MVRKLWIVLLALIPLAWAQQCPATGGTATLAQWSEPGNLNPLIFPTTYDTNVQELVFSSLIRTTSDLAFEPDLAESWTFSDDQTKITFTLRPGLTWHDGAPLTAEDAAFTLRSLMEPTYDGGSYADVSIIEGAEAYRSGEAADVSGIRVLDDVTLELTMSEPFAPALANLAGIRILPEHVYGKVDVARWQQDATNRNPLGSGPYRFVEWRPGELIALEAFDGYYAGRPCLDRILIRFGDQDTMLAALLSGEVDVAQVPINSVKSVEGRADVVLDAVDSLSFQYLGFNLRNAALAELPVRQAIAAAINRQALVDGLLRGYGRALDTILPTNHWSYPQDVAPIVYDVERAAELLEEAGWRLQDGVRTKNGRKLSFTLYFPTGNQIRERSAPIIQANLKQVGIELELQAMDFATLVTHLLPKDAQGVPRAVEAGDFDMFLLGFGVERDPDEYFSYFVAEGFPPNGYNFTGYTDPEVEVLLREGRTVLDVAAREAPYQEFGRIARDQLPWVPLYQPQDLFAHRTRLHGFSPDIRGVNPNAERWWVEK